jgi:hypothetical protein
MVNITSDRGLNKKYWDMAPELGGINTTDQTHHFAGYFWFGANVGTGSHRLNIATYSRDGLSGKLTKWYILY